MKFVHKHPTTAQRDLAIGIPSPSMSSRANTAMTRNAFDRRPQQPAARPAYRPPAARSSAADWTHIMVPVGKYDPSIVITHPDNAKHVADLRGALESLPALDLTISATPNCTELRNHGRVKVSSSMLKSDDPTGRAWEVGNFSRKVGKTFMHDGTNIRAKIHDGLAVINSPNEPLLVQRAVASLREFVRSQEARRDPTVTFSDRGVDGKFMIFYNHKKTDEMEQGADGKFVHVQYTATKVTHTHVNVQYIPNISNAIAALPKDTAVFVIRYLKGLAQLLECPTDEIFDWSMMLLDYCADGGFSSHTDGIKAFNNQAGIVVLVSLSDVEDQSKSFDLIPIWTLSKDRPIRITTKGRDGILMSGLARVDEPHSVPFNNKNGGRTLAIKMPFVQSSAPYIRKLKSQLSGVEVQMFDAAMAIESRQALLSSVQAPEFRPLSSVQAPEFHPLSAVAQEFRSMTLSVAAQEFVPTW